MPDILPKKDTQENFTSDILAAGPGSVAVIDFDGLKLHYCNKQFETTFFPPENVNNKNGISFATLLGETQQSRLKAQLQLVNTHPESRAKYAIYSIKTPGSAERSFYIYAAPLERQQENMSTLYHLLILPDLSKFPVPFISFDTRELFLQQFDNTRFCTFEWIIPGDKIFLSERVYNILEIDGDSIELNRSTIAAYVHPEDLKGATDRLSGILTACGTVNLKLRIITAKNNAKVLDIIAETLPGEDGKPFKLVGSARDITEQSKIEEDLKRNVSELNRSNRELEEFAYVASHDLQEPLRKISTFSDRLVDKYQDALSGEGAMYLERIIASAGSMRMLIDNLLDFSRLSTSRQPYTDVNLGFVLREVKTELELVIEETGTTIISSTLPDIEAVHSQARQLFTNILGNAIKFRKPGLAPVINITSTLLDDAEVINYHLPLRGDYYKLQITDNGIGFENEYAEKIFQIFQRLNAKSEYPGSGIGLAICKKIVDNHHGLIFAENIEGEGAQFTIILPAKQQNL